MIDIDYIDNIIEYSRHLKLLYVEDNKDSREMTYMLLEDFFDNIVVAVDGEDGYNKFINNDIDIIIADINMPKINGLDMIAKIREIDVDNEVSVIILSAHNEENFFIESIGLGVDGYLLKPIDINQLVSVFDKTTLKHKYIKEAKSNLHLLKEYQKATNKSSIVSKTDTTGTITFVNDKFCEISEYTREELIGKNHNIVRHPDNPKSIFKDMWHTIRDKKEIWQGLVRNRTKNNKSYYVDSVVMPILDLDGNILEYISLRNEITHIMSPAKQLVDAIKNAKEPVLIYIKLDNFDSISEFYNNETIETIQDEVEKYLQVKFSRLYDFDKIYQLSNGEYALIIEKLYLKEESSFIQTLQGFQKVLHSNTIMFNDIKYDISLVISLVYQKDQMLESAKLGIKKLLKNKENFILANNLAAIEQEKAIENMKVVSMIKNAITDSKIISYFQPILDNTTMQITKHESLVRLINEKGEVLTPFYFLETAKKSNYYTQITDIVLEYSFSILDNANIKEVSINLSAIDIEWNATRLKVFELLEKYKDVASRVIFELLEDETVKDFNVVKKFIADVKEYGVQIAIDDFGAGYSNYERLLEYAPDILKIDGSLIRDLETNEYSRSIVKSIVTFSKEQGIKTVAEFIENEAVFKIVKDLGVDFSQGYYFGKPEAIEGL